MHYYLQLFINGLVVGGIYSLVALGFVVIYKATQVVNFAQGELFMAGAYVCFSLTVQFHVPFLWAFLMTLGFSVLLGVAMRATAFDQQAAQSMGIGIKNIFALSWCIACVVSGVGGVILGNINGINSQHGYLGLKVFPAVILGGLDSLAGAALGGLIVGVLENLCDGLAKDFLGLSGFKEVAAFVVLVLILMIKPYGLFGSREIERV